VRKRTQATSTKHLLPFDELSPAQVERLCLWLVEREVYPTPHILFNLMPRSGHSPPVEKDIRSQYGALCLTRSLKKYKAFSQAQEASTANPIAIDEPGHQRNATASVALRRNWNYNMIRIL
jgi:hypothetical protein